MKHAIPLLALLLASCGTYSADKSNPLFQVSVQRGSGGITLEVQRDPFDDTPTPRYNGAPQGNVDTYFHHHHDGVDWWQEFEKARPEVRWDIGKGEFVQVNPEHDLPRWRAFVERFKEASRGREQWVASHAELARWSTPRFDPHIGIVTGVGAYHKTPRGPFPLPCGHRFGTWFTGGWAPSKLDGHPLSLGLAYFDYLDTVVPVWAGNR